MDWARIKATRAEMRGKFVNIDDDEDRDGGGGGGGGGAAESSIVSLPLRGIFP